MVLLKISLPNTLCFPWKFLETQSAGRRAKAPPDSLHTLSPRVPWRRPRVRRSRPSRLVTVSVPPRLDLQSQSRPPGRAFARPGRPGRTWQRRLFTNSPLEPPTRYPPHPLNLQLRPTYGHPCHAPCSVPPPRATSAYQTAAPDAEATPPTYPGQTPRPLPTLRRWAPM